MLPDATYDDEEDSPLLARLYPRFKPQPWDASPARADDCALVARAMQLQPGRESYTISACRQIVSMERERERRAETAAKAKARYRAKAASRRA